jgi:hypothetical protein
MIESAEAGCRGWPSSFFPFGTDFMQPSSAYYRRCSF